MEGESYKEERIRKVTSVYYSRKDVQKSMLEFSKNREISPRYFEGFGKRPDVLEYAGDIMHLSKKGATSFHCSEEIWEDPLMIETGMNEKQLNALRKGWDLVLDIDCKWIDYSKLAAEAIVKSLKMHGVENVGVKFSGSKGFHIIVPWEAFPKELNGIEMKNLFPEVPRKLASYIAYHSEKLLKESLPDNFYSQFKDVKINRGYRCKKCGSIATETKQVEFKCERCKITEIRKFSGDVEIPVAKCYKCKKEFNQRVLKSELACGKCHQWREGFDEVVEIDLYELLGLDIVLVSPRHLFRMPYSLHEKTSLASVVIDADKIKDFDMKDADPMKVSVKDFMPSAREGEAKELLIQALDWYKENVFESGKKVYGKFADFKPVKLENFSEEQFPESVRKILEGVSDGRKRALFVLINLFRSLGFDKEDLEKRIYEWNKKNEIPLKEGYITTQLIWSYRKKPILPPNFNSDLYKGIGVLPTPEELRFKNPVSYVVSKNKFENSRKRGKVKNSGERKQKNRKDEKAEERS